MGNAVDNDQLLMQPYQLLELMPLLAELYDEAHSLGVMMQAGNNIGYFGPYEHKWRIGNEETHWSGCSAGHAVLGIEADGDIKGCPSLPTRDYSGGNVRDMTIEDIWTYSREIRFSRDRTDQRAVGPLPRLLLRRRLPRRLHVDLDGALRPSRQQSVLPSPRARTCEAADCANAWRKRRRRRARRSIRDVSISSPSRSTAATASARLPSRRIGR